MVKQVICENCGKIIGETIFHAKGYVSDCCSIDCVRELYSPEIRTEENKHHRK